MQDGIIEFTKYTLDNLGVQIFNTIVLVGVLWVILYNPVKDFLQRRTDKIADELNNAASNLKKSNELKLTYETKIKEIEKERTEILETARKLAKENETNIIADAKKEAELIKSRAMSDIKLEEEKAKDSIKNQIIETSMLMTQKFISSNIDEATQNKLIEEVISDLGESKWLS